MKMSRTNAALIVLVTLSILHRPAAAVTIDMVPVGNPGNANDPSTGSLYGAVPYAYNIGKYEVTVGQYVEFLNAKDPTGANMLGLYNSAMSNANFFGGINFTPGNPSGNKYSAIAGRENHPANFTTWWDAIRFANWLHNGQGNGDTETGAYTLLGGTPLPSDWQSIARNPGAKVFIPSENEWYKAAYYDANTGSYFRYPTSSNTAPIASSPTGVANQANFDSVVSNPTDVGGYTGTTSPYGAFDMGGNLWEWNEGPAGSPVKGLRGGSFGNVSGSLLSSTRFGNGPSNENAVYGFRVASIPEPSTLLLLCFGSLAVLWRRRGLVCASILAAVVSVSCRRPCGGRHVRQRGQHVRHRVRHHRQSGQRRRHHGQPEPGRLGGLHLPHGQV